MYDLAKPSQIIVARQSPWKGEPVITPSGEHLYYTHAASSGSTFIYHEDSHGELFEIRSLSLVDGETDTVAGGYGGAVRAVPSPSGNYLAYVKRVRAESRLFVKDSNGILNECSCLR